MSSGPYVKYPFTQSDASGNGPGSAAFAGGGSAADHLLLATEDDTLASVLSLKLVAGDTLIDLTEADSEAGGKILKTLLNIDNLVTELDAHTDLTATPKGPAAFDITGTYPDKVLVQQLTGVGAQLVAMNLPGMAWTPNPFHAGPYYGRTMSHGSAYVLDLLTTSQKAKPSWAAFGNSGQIFRSFDNFKTAIADTSFSTFLASSPHSVNGSVPLSLGGERFTGMFYMTIPGRPSAPKSWVVFGDFEGYCYADDIPTNYNDDGTLKSSAWVYFYISQGTLPKHIGHIVASPDGSGYFICASFADAIKYTTDIYTTPHLTDAVTGQDIHSGLAYDSYGTYLAIQRGNGFIWINNSYATTGIFSPTAWKQLTSTLGMTVDGQPASMLPVSGNPAPPAAAGLGSTWWSGMACAYGLWVVAVAFKYDPTKDPTYAYSSDGINWTTYGKGDPDVISFWDLGTDGADFFAAKVNAPSPIVYQALVNSIPSHKRFVCEEGIMIKGPAFLGDLPNADVAGTDGNGKFVKKAATDIGVGKILTSDNDTTLAKLQSKLVDSFGATFGETDGAQGKAIIIPTAKIAGSPNGQELFSYCICESKSAIPMTNGVSVGTRAFAFVALSSLNAARGRIFISQVGSTWVRMGIYDADGTLKASSPRVPVGSGASPALTGMIWCPFMVPFALQGGNIYYMAISCNDNTANDRYACLSGRSTESDSPQSQLFDDHLEMPDTLSTSGTRTALRPWMMISEAST